MSRNVLNLQNYKDFVMSCKHSPVVNSQSTYTNLCKNMTHTVSERAGLAAVSKSHKEQQRKERIKGGCCCFAKLVHTYLLTYSKVPNKICME